MENKIYMAGGKDYEHKSKYLSKSKFQKLPLIYR